MPVILPGQTDIYALTDARLSCGRTDFEGGSMEVELQSLAKIAALPGDYEVYPGHMDCSTLETERRFNPYLTALQNRGQ